MEDQIARRNARIALITSILALLVSFPAAILAVEQLIYERTVPEVTVSFQLLSTCISESKIDFHVAGRFYNYGRFDVFGMKLEATVYLPLTNGDSVSIRAPPEQSWTSDDAIPDGGKVTFNATVRVDLSQYEKYISAPLGPEVDLRLQIAYHSPLTYLPWDVQQNTPAQVFTSSSGAGCH